MGDLIRFDCPNCKRHVKTERANAGKTAVCVCGARVRVPAPNAERTTGFADIAGPELTFEAREIVSKKPRAWEYRLFGQVILDECERYRRDSCPPVPAFHNSSLSLPEFLAWSRTKGDECFRMLTEMKPLVNANHEDAFGPPGRPGNVAKIVNLAKEFAAYYKRMMIWMEETREAPPGSRYRQITHELRLAVRPILDGIEQFGRSILSTLDRELPLSGGAPTTISLTWTIPAPDFTRYFQVLEQLMADEERRILEARKATLTFNSSAGYLYLLMNPSFLGMIKVGKTERSAEERAKELYTTGVPTPFLCVFDLYVDDCAQAEKYVHSTLEKRGHRVSGNREFFTAPSNEAIEIMLEAQKLVRRQP